MSDIEPTVEAVARSLAETAIRNARMFDTPPERVEELLPEAVEHCWHGYVDAARKAIAAYEAKRPHAPFPQTLKLGQRVTMPPTTIEYSAHLRGWTGFVCGVRADHLTGEPLYEVSNCWPPERNPGKTTWFQDRDLSIVLTEGGAVV